MIYVSICIVSDEPGRRQSEVPVEGRGKYFTLNEVFETEDFLRKVKLLLK